MEGLIGAPLLDTLARLPDLEEVIAAQSDSLEARLLLREALRPKPNQVTLQDLRKVFTLSRQDAARHLGLGVTTLRRCCASLGVVRWPHRKLLSLQRLRDHHLAQPLPDPAAQEDLLRNIQREIDAIMLDPQHTVADLVKRTRATTARQSYKRRGRGRATRRIHSGPSSDDDISTSDEKVFGNDPSLAAGDSIMPERNPSLAVSAGGPVAGAAVHATEPDAADPAPSAPSLGSVFSEQAESRRLSLNQRPNSSGAANPGRPGHGFFLRPHGKPAPQPHLVTVPPGAAPQLTTDQHEALLRMAMHITARPAGDLMSAVPTQQATVPASTTPSSQTEAAGERSPSVSQLQTSEQLSPRAQKRPASMLDADPPRERGLAPPSSDCPRTVWQVKPCSSSAAFGMQPEAARHPRTVSGHLPSTPEESPLSETGTSCSRQFAVKAVVTAGFEPSGNQACRLSAPEDLYQTAVDSLHSLRHAFRQQQPTDGAAATGMQAAALPTMAEALEATPPVFNRPPTQHHHHHHHHVLVHPSSRTDDCEIVDGWSGGPTQQCLVRHEPASPWSLPPLALAFGTYTYGTNNGSPLTALSSPSSPSQVYGPAQAHGTCRPQAALPAALLAMSPTTATYKRPSLLDQADDPHAEGEQRDWPRTGTELSQYSHSTLAVLSATDVGAYNTGERPVTRAGRGGTGRRALGTAAVQRQGSVGYATGPPTRPGSAGRAPVLRASPAPVQLPLGLHKTSGRALAPASDLHRTASHSSKRRLSCIDTAPSTQACDTAVVSPGSQTRRLPFGQARLLPVTVGQAAERPLEEYSAHARTSRWVDAAMAAKSAPVACLQPQLPLWEQPQQPLHQQLPQPLPLQEQQPSPLQTLSEQRAHRHNAFLFPQQARLHQQGVHNALMHQQQPAAPAGAIHQAWNRLFFDDLPVQAFQHDGHGLFPSGQTSGASTMSAGAAPPYHAVGQPSHSCNLPATTQPIGVECDVGERPTAEAMAFFKEAAAAGGLLAQPLLYPPGGQSQLAVADPAQASAWPSEVLSLDQLAVDPFQIQASAYLDGSTTPREGELFDCFGLADGMEIEL